MHERRFLMQLRRTTNLVLMMIIVCQFQLSNHESLSESEMRLFMIMTFWDFLNFSIFYFILGSFSDGRKNWRLLSMTGKLNGSTNWEMWTENVGKLSFFETAQAITWVTLVHRIVTKTAHVRKKSAKTTLVSCSLFMSFFLR